MSISALSLPGLFLPKTSAKILLPPEPTYLWANLLYNSEAAAELARGAGQPYGPTPMRQLQSSGVAAPDPKDSAFDPNAGLSMTFKDAIVVEKFSVPSGKTATVKMNRLVFADTTYTLASRRVTRTTIGTTAVDLTNDQVEITIERFAGPYTGSAVGPHIIEEFDLDKTDEDLSERVAVHLRRDRTKFVDTVVAELAVNGAASANRIYPGDPDAALTTDNGAFLAQGDRTWDLESCFRAEEMAKTNKIPTFPNGRWMGVMTARQERQLKTNGRFEKMTKNYAEKNPIFGNYIGTLGMTDWFTSQTNPTTTANSTITVQLGVVMGPGALGYGCTAKPCHVRPDDSTNYGQRVAIIWVCDEGFVRLDNRFLVSCRSD